MRKLQKKIQLRGKKIDTNFVAEFVSECVKLGKISEQEICEEAKQRMNEIDIQIKKVEELKKVRSKLFDVLISFNSLNKNHTADILALDFHKVKHREISSFIIKNISEESVIQNSMKDNIQNLIAELNRSYSNEDVNLTVKQLAELEVLKITGKKVSLGKNGEDYKSFLHLLG